jgi:hypothetical protein
MRPDLILLFLLSFAGRTQAGRLHSSSSTRGHNSSSAVAAPVTPFSSPSSLVFPRPESRERRVESQYIRSQRANGNVVISNAEPWTLLFFGILLIGISRILRTFSISRLPKDRTEVVGFRAG